LAQVDVPAVRRLLAALQNGLSTFLKRKARPPPCFAALQKGTLVLLTCC